MPITLNLEEDGRVLVYVITDPIEISALMSAYEQERKFRDDSPLVTHSITDLSGLRGIPFNWLRAKSGPGLSHPRSGEMIIVGMSPGVTLIITTMMRIVRFERLKLMKTMDQARAYLRTVIAQEVPIQIPS